MFGWLWAMAILMAAVLRHLAGEGPVARTAHADGVGHEGCAHVSAASAGKAWAEKEEKRFREPRCC
jgi:hypothetical protein